MSWGNNNLQPIRKDQIAEIEIDPQTVPEGCEGAFADQLAAARTAAEVLAESVGGPDSLVIVSMGGHANPDHASNHEGYGDETIHVAVSITR